ncbi:MAG: hypothetical protein IJ702_09770 [Fretibacterium sp.]|nr:hypothetical protein [Fretibacterium sp.]
MFWRKLSLSLFLSLLFALVSLPARAGVETWHDPSFNFSGMRKIFILPIETELKARPQSSVVPQKQQDAELSDWAVSGVRSALIKNKPIIKSFDALMKDLLFLHKDLSAGTEKSILTDEKVREEIFKKAADIGYQAAIQITVTQSMKVEHIPERTQTYTTYREVETYDNKGRKTGSIRIPEERTEITPAYDEEHLSTRCLTKLYDISAPNGDHKAAVENSIYRRYQGAPS